MSFQSVLTEDRRLSILLVLAETPGYAANAFLVRDAIGSIYGHSASVDVVVSDLAWLQEQGLVTAKAAGGVTVATLTVRGVDVSTGRALCPGVKKPLP